MEDQIARQIVCEEWHRAVKEFGLTPGSTIETVVSRIINRLDGTAPEATAPARKFESVYEAAFNHITKHPRLRERLGNAEHRDVIGLIDAIAAATEAALTAALASRKEGLAKRPVAFIFRRHDGTTGVTLDEEYAQSHDADYQGLYARDGSPASPQGQARCKSGSLGCGLAINCADGQCIWPGRYMTPDEIAADKSIIGTAALASQREAAIAAAIIHDLELPIEPLNITFKPGQDNWRTMERLAEFAKWAIREGAFDGTDLDGGDIQDKAEELGILIRTKYDPAKHGESADVDPGDDWFEFADWLPSPPHAGKD